MNKPNKYAETQVKTGFTPIELGGHKMVIKQVSEKQSSTGKDMLVVLVDTDKTDKQPGYFMDLFNKDTRPDKKYPSNGTVYIVTTDNEGNCSSKFKSFCESVEGSNTGFSCWNKDDSFNFAGIKGKKVGAVFGEELDAYEGKETRRNKLKWWCKYDEAENQKIPNVYETEEHKQWAAQPINTLTGTTDFMNIPDGLDEELPFN